MVGVSDVAFDATPSRLGVGLPVLFGLVAVASTGLVTPAGPIAAIGVAVATVGIARASYRVLAVGTLGTFAGVVLAALAGVDPLVVVVGAGAALLAWDAGAHAIGLGAQLGRRARMRGALLVHVGATTTVVAAVVVVAYGVFQLARAGQPGAAAVVLAGAVALFALVLDW